jgi:GNAT superfamily N-acetyltransferase
MNDRSHDSLRCFEIADGESPVASEAFALYRDAFPEGERETRAAMESWMAKQASGVLLPDAYHMVAGCARGSVLCMASFHYLAAIRGGFLGYIVVAPAARGKGLGARFFGTVRDFLERDAASRSAKLRAIYMELDREDPSIPETTRRLGFWKRLGVFPLDFAWQYPPLHGGQPPAMMDLAAVRFEDDPQRVSSVELCEASRAIYRSVYGKGEEDPLLLQVLRSLDGREFVGRRGA